MHFAQLQTLPEIKGIAKVIILAVMSFSVAMAITPLVAHYLYKYKIGIKIKSKSVSGEKLNFVSKLHAHKAGTPTMGGIIVWASVILLAILMGATAPFFSKVFQNVWLARLDFLSRSQTWLPFFFLIATAILGLADDYMSIKKIGGNKGGGMRFLWRMAWLFGIASLGAWWFYGKLGWDAIHVPAVGDFTIGLWYIPLFIFTIVAMTVSSNETDGLDGLNAGILIQGYAAFSVIAYFQHRMDLAAFCAVVAGALVAFLWFNFYPARFIMGDTGATALGATLGVVAMLTNSVLILPLIVFIYVLESSSAVIQLTSKKLFHRKVFLAAPIHHHFEAMGWPETKVTVRFWIINLAIGIMGMLVGIIGAG